MSATARPYVTEIPFLPPPPQYGYSFRYASLGSRFEAAILDLIILGVISLVIAIPFGILAGLGYLATGGVGWVPNLILGPLTALLVLLWLAYFTYFESTTGRTPGKSAAGIKVVAIATMQPPDLGHALLRNVVRIIDWLPAFYLLGALIADSSSRTQRLGDVMAETIVIQG